MRRGIVFTMDAVFAILILMVMMTTVITLLEIHSKNLDSTLALSRLARDVYEVEYYESGVTFPTWISTGNECDNSENVVSERAVVYAGHGSLTTVVKRVCIK